MANEQNLIPCGHVLTEEEASRGGKASGEARRNKKRMAELAKQLAIAPAPEKAKDKLKAIGFEDENLTGSAMVVAGVFSKATKGEAQAVEKWEEWTEGISDNPDADKQTALGIAMRNLFNNIGKTFRSAVGEILSHSFTHYEFRGGRGSLKSSFVSLIVVILIMSFDGIHALVLRKVANTLRDSVYAQYLWAIGVLGVSDYWEASKTPMELVFKPTGQKIMFRGADDPMKIKSIKVPFGYIAITHFEEKDQFSGRKEIRDILQSTIRGGSQFWNFESYNPPISRDNWANKDSLEERPDRICHVSDYTMVQEREWLGEQFYAEAEHLKETDEKAYRHEYLGEATGSGGNVFEKLELREITDEEISHFDRIYQGVDWGWFPDPFAFIRLHYDRARETIYFIDEIYENKLPNEQSAKMIAERGYKDEYITCDSAEPKSIADFRACGLPAKEAVKGPGSVDYGMKWLQSRTIVIDRRRTPHAYEEYVNYEYERNKDDEIISGYPDANNHLIDATRYALERVYRRFGSNA